MDDKLKRIQQLKDERKKIDDEITKLSADAAAELQAIVNAGKKPRKPRTPKQQPLPLPVTAQPNGNAQKGT